MLQHLHQQHAHVTSTMKPHVHRKPIVIFEKSETSPSSSKMPLKKKNTNMFLSNTNAMNIVHSVHKVISCQRIPVHKLRGMLNVSQTLKSPNSDLPIVSAAAHSVKILNPQV